MKLKKRKKSSRMHGRGRGSHGWGERKKHKKKGHRGGKGMAGTGKRADQKKTLITNLYGHYYFGKKGITSKSTKKDKRRKINLREIQLNLEKYGKKSGDKWEIKLENYKILGEGEVKDKLVINAKDVSKSALKKIKDAGGEIIIKNVSKKEKSQDKAQIKDELK